MHTFFNKRLWMALRAIACMYNVHVIENNFFSLLLLLELLMITNDVGC